MLVGHPREVPRPELAVLQQLVAVELERGVAHAQIALQRHDDLVQLLHVPVQLLESDLAHRPAVAHVLDVRPGLRPRGAVVSGVGFLTENRDSGVRGEAYQFLQVVV